MKRKNSKYLEFIRRQHCCYCGNPNTVAHHVRDKEYLHKDFVGGTSLKPFDEVSIALCTTHHQDAHSPGKFEEDLQPAKLIQLYNIMYIREIQ